MFKAVNKDGKMKTRYDEMQELQRGRAYKYSFWTLAGSETLVCLLQLAQVKLLMDPFTANLTCILLAALVHASYSVNHDAYIGLNTNYKRFVGICVGIGVFNFLISMLSFQHDGWIRDGVLQPPFANLLCAIVFIILGVEMYIKNRTEKNEEED